jgi:hypothetical protein
MDLRAIGTLAAASLLAIGTAACARGAQWVPVAAPPFLTPHGAALWLAWRTTSPAGIPHLVVNAPPDAAGPDSFLLRDLQRWAQVVTLHRDTAMDLRALPWYDSLPRSYELVDIRSAATFSPSEWLPGGEGVWFLRLESCRGWPCGRSATVSVRRAPDGFHPVELTGEVVQ